MSRPGRSAGTSAGPRTRSARRCARSPTAWPCCPYSNGVHHDGEPGRRPLFHRLVADGTLPTGYATDDGAGLLYRGTTLVEALAERPRAGAYRVERYGSGGAVETALDVRRLV